MIAYHIIFSAYGFWLPNDPRGSYSTFVGAWDIFRYGPATPVATRRSVASRKHDHQLRIAAKNNLKYRPVVFTGVQARAVGRGFSLASQESDYVIYACAILPEHVHVVLARHRNPVPRIVGHLKSRASFVLAQEDIHPKRHLAVPGKSLPSPWGEGFWKVYLDNIDDMRRAIDYVEENPVKEGKPRQRWSFVTPFANAPHSATDVAG